MREEIARPFVRSKGKRAGSENPPALFIWAFCNSGRDSADTLPQPRSASVGWQYWMSAEGARR